MGTQAAITHTEGPPRLVGHVYASIRISNNIDIADERRGLIAPSAVRSIDLNQVLVDTGASHLCLPLDMVQQLGLDFVEEVQVKLAAGDQHLGFYAGAQLDVEGRTSVQHCLALPPGSAPLLGVIALEDLGVEPDLEHRRLRILPRWGRSSYLRA